MSHALAEQIFCALDQLESCLAPKDVPKRADFQALFRYVTIANSPEPTGLDHADSQRDLIALLDRHAPVHFPLAAAASSGAVTERLIEGVKLSLRPSLSTPNQVFLLLESDDANFAPQMLFVFAPDQRPLRLSLGESIDGQSQTLLSMDHPIVKGLHHHQSRVIVR